MNSSRAAEKKRAARTKNKRQKNWREAEMRAKYQQVECFTGNQNLNTKKSYKKHSKWSIF